MIKKSLDYKNFIKPLFLNKSRLKSLDSKLHEILKLLPKLIKSKNETLNVLDKNFKFNFDFKDIKKFKKFNSLVIIGMGGSILGTEAIYQFLNHKIKKEIFFLDDLNEIKISDLKKKIIFKKTLFLIISKSGNTIETLSNSLFLNLIKKKSKNIIIISEKKNNTLFNFCKKMKLFFVEHKNFIGGRYSVLSEVGILPSYFMGLNIKKLRSETENYKKNKEKFFLRRSALHMACALKEKKFKNIIFLNYVPQLEKFLYWSQQLIAESLGKKNLGFLPVISNVPKDHHSLLQLYLDGPKDKIFTIFSFKGYKNQKVKNKNFKNSLNFLNNKTLSKIKEAQKNALIKSFKKNNIPFREFKIQSISEKTLSELFSFYILETFLIGKLANIDPFNQPAVEQVKNYTKQLLK